MPPKKGSLDELIAAQKKTQKIAEASLVLGIANNIQGMVNLTNQIKTEMRLATQGEQQQATMFMTVQICNLLLRFASIQRSITLASNDYNEILQTKASEKLDIVSIALFVGLAVLPEIAALGLVLKKAQGWERAWANISVSAAKGAGKAFDIRKFFLGAPPPPSGLPQANDVLADCYDLILKQMSSAVALQTFATYVILFAGLPKPYQWITGLWGSAVGTLQPVGSDELLNQSNILRQALLYDMLRLYVSSYVTFEIGGMDFQKAKAMGLLKGSVLSLPQLQQMLNGVPNSLVTVHGMNDNQREKIYHQFSAVPWTDTKRPPVNSWRDLAVQWAAKIPGLTVAY